MYGIEEAIKDIGNAIRSAGKKINGLHKAVVAENLDLDLAGNPVDSGRIKVYCPTVYGVRLNGRMIKSPPCEPCFPSPHDFTVPELGQNIWIGFEDGDIDAPVWLGSYPTIYQKRVEKFSNSADENVFLEDEFKEGKPLSVENPAPVADGETEQIGGVIEEAVDRVIASRFGSYIKFDDRNKKIVLELLGKTAVAPDRVGPKIELEMDYDEDSPDDPAANFSSLSIELPFGKDSVENPATADKTTLFLSNNALSLKIRSVDDTTDKFSIVVDATDEGGGKIDIKAAEGKTIISVDKEGNFTLTTAENLTLSSGGGSGEEKSILGETLKGKLEELIDEINKITVPTGVGPSGTPINAAALESISTGLSDILSVKTKNN